MQVMPRSQSSSCFASIIISVRVVEMIPSASSSVASVDRFALSRATEHVHHVRHPLTGISLTVCEKKFKEGSVIFFL